MTKEEPNEPDKGTTRAHLFQIAVRALEHQGWKVERIARCGKSSVRRILKGKLTKTVTIRTSQDTWIAFTRNMADNQWVTLDEVDYVLAASVYPEGDPQFAEVYMIEGDEMRERFNRAYEARKRAGYVIEGGTGFWLSLYDRETDRPVTLVGAGAVLGRDPIAREPLNGEAPEKIERNSPTPNEEPDRVDVEVEEGPITITEAKRRLAASLGVNEADIRITISS
jgi:hypothetical protein